MVGISSLNGGTELLSSAEFDSGGFETGIPDTEGLGVLQVDVTVIVLNVGLVIVVVKVVRDGVPL